MRYHVRLGALAEIHRATGPPDLGRGRRVIVRTRRGTEVAEVLDPLRENAKHRAPSDGSAVSTLSSGTDAYLGNQTSDAFAKQTKSTFDDESDPSPGVQSAGSQNRQNPPSDGVRILRVASSSDDLLIRRLNRFRRRAVRECQLAMRQTGCPGVLLDIDQLFDGGTLILHFMGADQTTYQATEPVVKKYESIVRTRQLAKQLTVGCGPGCGTSDSSGCGGSCSSCSIAGACRTAAK